MGTVHFSMPQSYKDRVDKYCSENELTRSELLRRWIDEHIENSIFHSGNAPIKIPGYKEFKILKRLE